MHYRTDPKCAPPPLSTIRTVKHSHINSLSRCHTPASPPGLILLGSVQLTHALTPSHSLNHSVTHSSPARSRHPPPLRLGAQGQVRPRARPTLRSRRYANLCMQIRVPLSVSSSASAPCVLAGSSPVCTEAREQAWPHCVTLSALTSRCLQARANSSASWRGRLGFDPALNRSKPWENRARCSSHTIYDLRLWTVCVPFGTVDGGRLWSVEGKPLR